jgi:hypothetical protein
MEADRNTSLIQATIFNRNESRREGSLVRVKINDRLMIKSLIERFYGLVGVPLKGHTFSLIYRDYTALFLFIVL